MAGIFWMNVPLALVAIALAVWLLPARRQPSGAISLDPVGLAHVRHHVVSLMWPFLFTTGSPDDDPARWWLLVVFVFAVDAFIGWERRYAASGKPPLVPLALFGGSRTATARARHGVLRGAARVFLLTTLYLQQGLGLEPVYAGMVTIGFALTSAVTSWIGGNLVNRIGRPARGVGHRAAARRSRAARGRWR